MKAIFTSRKMAVVFLLGFSSGIPLALTAGTLQAWMKDEHVDLSVIGLFSLVGLPYTLKFLWAPLMDRFVPPFLGRRRGWVVIWQIALVLGLLAMAFHSPSVNPVMTAFLAVMVAFFSASQDIVVDAYRTDVVDKDEVGPSASLYVTGYRAAMIVSSSVALIMADHMSWAMVYSIMAMTVLIGTAAAFLAPEPVGAGAPPKDLREAIVLPFVDYFKRKGAFEILLFIIFYRLDAVIAMAMMTPFLMDLGFSKTDLGTINKGLGLLATIVGTLAGGGMMVKIGMKRALVLFGLAQAAANLVFISLARAGHNYPLLVATIVVDNFCAGLGTAAFSAFLMTLCNKRFTATQYALLTSLMAVTRVIGGAPTGYLAQAVGWEMYFVVSSVVFIPGLLLLMRYDYWMQGESLEDPGLVVPAPAK